MILTIPINYQTSQIELLRRQVDEFLKLPNNQVVTVSTHEIDNLPGEVLVLPDNGPLFMWRYLDVLNHIVDIDKYDYIIVTESDMLFTPAHFEYFNKYADLLPDNYVPGFIRYEQKDDVRSLVDLSVIPETIHSTEEINGKQYFTNRNEHQAIFVLNRKHIEIAKQSGNFLEEPARHPCPDGSSIGLIESATYRAIAGCNLKRVIPLEAPIDDYLIHHTSNKYTNVYNKITDTSLVESINAKNFR